MRLIDIEKIHRIHKRAILDYCGMPLSEHPKKIEGVNRTLHILSEGSKEQFDKAYDVIVNRKISSGDTNGFIASKAAELALNNIELRKIKVVEDFAKEIDREVKDASSDIRNAALEEIEKARNEFVTIQVKIGNKKPKKIKGILCEEFPQLLELAQERVNIMMVGPAGCGKTHIGGQMAEALNLDYASQSCSAGMSESQLTGWLLPIGDKGKFEYVSSEFVRIYENGGIFLFDEMDAADPNVLIFINQALANGQFSLPQRFENPTVKKHKDFVAVAATNTFGGGADSMYHARNALDASTLDRFKIGMTIIEYSKIVEESLVDKDILQWGREIRKAIEINNMQKIMSTRVLLDATKMKNNQEWNLKKISSSYFNGWSREEITVVKSSCSNECEIPIVINPF